MSKIKVKNATKAGFTEVRNGGVLDLSFPDSNTRRGRVIDDGETSPTLNTGCEIGVVQVGNIYGTENEPNPKAGRIYAADGISPTLGANSGGNNMPMIVGIGISGHTITGEKEIANCLNANDSRKFTGANQEHTGVMLDDGRVVRIRKLTPKECFRLQGWTDDYFEKAQFVNSDSQLYKQAGNGVTVNVIYEIARRME